MSEVRIIGLDIAKHVFQAHGVDASGHVVLRQKISRTKLLSFFAAQPRCRVVLEACGGAHYWARELIAPAYVKPFVKRQKNDAAECRGDLRGSTASQHAVCAGEDRRAAGSGHGVPGP